MAKLSTRCQIYCFLLFLTALLSQKCCTDGIVIYERNLFNDFYSRVLKYSKAKFLQNVFFPKNSARLSVICLRFYKEAVICVVFFIFDSFIFSTKTLSSLGSVCWPRWKRNNCTLEMELRASPKLLGLLSDMLASRAGLIISIIIVFEAAKNSLREESERI